MSNESVTVARLRQLFTPGAFVTLAFNQWKGSNLKGTSVEVIRARKDKRCKTGLRVFVRMNGGYISGLDASWFMELPKDILI